GILPPGNRRTAVDSYEQLVGLSHELHPTWSAQLRAETGIDNGYRRTGGLHIARGAAGNAELPQELDYCPARQIPCEEVAAEDIAEVEPALAGHGQQADLHALRLTSESQLRNPRHLQALLAACSRRGVSIQADAAAEGFAVERGRIGGVRTATGLLS